MEKKGSSKIIGGEVKRSENDVSPFPFKDHQALEPFKDHQELEPFKDHQELEPFKDHQKLEPFKDYETL